MTEPSEHREDAVAHHLHARYAGLPQAPRNESAVSLDRNPAAAEAEAVTVVATAYLEAFDASLVAAYGWSAIDHRLAVDRSRRHLLVRVHTALPVLTHRLMAGLRATIAKSWHITVSSAAVHHEWASLCDGVTSVWRECAFENQSTQYLREDGPVLVLRQTYGLTLIRGTDGTTGWTANALTSCRPAPRGTELVVSLRPSDWPAKIRSYLGVPYQIGGTTGVGIDCTGLTQRLLRELAGLITPRHTTDQLAFFGLLRRAGPIETGDLIFLQSDDQLWHVGVTIKARDGSCSVVHASSSAGRVVEHSMDEYLRAGIRHRVGRVLRKRA